MSNNIPQHAHLEIKEARSHLRLAISFLPEMDSFTSEEGEEVDLPERVKGQLQDVDNVLGELQVITESWETDND